VDAEFAFSPVRFIKPPFFIKPIQFIQRLIRR
jgi:hypothetical protein